MSSILPFIVIGLTTGSVYALAGVGLVVTYKTSGVFNFAQGSLATVAAYVFYELRERHALPWTLAAAISVISVGVGGGYLLARLAAAIAAVETALQVVAMVGVAVAVQGVAVTFYGAQIRNVGAFLPRDTFELLDVNVGYDQVIVFGFGAVVAAALAVFFKRSIAGLAMRGVVGDPTLLALSGHSPDRVRTLAWIIGSSLAAVSGVLLVPSLGLDSVLLTLLVVQAFGAAAVGAFSNVPLAYLGGIGVGVGQALATKYAADFSVLRGLPASLPFLVLFLVLLVLQRRHLVSPIQGHLKRIRTMRPVSRPVGAIAYAVSGAVLLAVPLFVGGGKLNVWTTGLCMAVVFASLHLLVHTSGQVSLCQPAFVAVGATTFANLSYGPGVPWPVALVVAGLVAVPVGALVAIPAIRLSTVYLAVATYGFAILVDRMFYRTGLMFGSFGSRWATRPSIGGVDLTSDHRFYYVVLGVTTLAMAVAVAVRRSRLGRLLEGLAGSPVGLEGCGTSVTMTRVLAFCIAAFLAAIGGGLLASTSVTVSAAGLSSDRALLWLVVLVFAATVPFAGTSIVGSSLAAAAMLVVIPNYIGTDKVLDVLPIVSGLSAIFVAMTAARDPGRRRQRRRAVQPGTAIDDIRARALAMERLK